jgi:hypothetical protein
MVDHHVGTIDGERGRDGLAGPGASAGHQSDLANQSPLTIPPATVPESCRRNVP